MIWVGEVTQHIFGVEDREDPGTMYDIISSLRLLQLTRIATYEVEGLAQASSHIRRPSWQLRADLVLRPGQAPNACLLARGR